MKGSLQFVPEGYRVVPEEPTEEQLKEMMGAIDECQLVSTIYAMAIESAPLLTTPPVLRWEMDNTVGYFILKIGNKKIGHAQEMVRDKWIASPCITRGICLYDTEQEARRAAEKALGIPFEVEEV